MEEYIKSEIILREMALDSKARMDLDSLTKWLITALGLGSPRSKALVYLVKKLLQYRFMERYLKFSELNNPSVSIKTLYYHLHRLQEMGLVKKTPEGYILGESLKEPLKEFLKRYYRQRTENALEMVNQALDSFKAKTLL